MLNRIYGTLLKSVLNFIYFQRFFVVIVGKKVLLLIIFQISLIIARKNFFIFNLKIRLSSHTVSKAFSRSIKQVSTHLLSFNCLTQVYLSHV